MEIHGLTNRLVPNAVSSLSVGQKPLPVDDDPAFLLQKGKTDEVAAFEKNEAKKAMLPEKQPVTFEDRLKMMISAEDIRRLMYLYSPFGRQMLVTEAKGQSLNQKA